MLANSFSTVTSRKKSFDSLASMTLFSVIFLILLHLTLPSRFISSDPTAWTARTQNPVITSPLTASQRSLPAIKIDPSGKIYTTQILKQQLSNELRLPLRDLRVVDPSLPKQIQATFTSRPHVILFCIENIKVIVQHDEALIFNPYQPEVKEMIPTLQQLLTQASETANSVVTGRFEHLVIEAALNVVCTNLIRQVRELSPAVASTLNGIRAESRGLDVVQTQVDELLPQKNKLDELRKRVKEVKRAITDILNNDEDMAMMYLSPKPFPDRYQSEMNSTTEDLTDEHPLYNYPNIGEYSTPTTTSSSSSDDITMKMEDVGDFTSPSSLQSRFPGLSNIRPTAIPYHKRRSGNSWRDDTEDNRRSNSQSSSSSEVEFIVDTMGLEMLFENYLNEIEWIASEIEEIIDEITNTEEYVVLQLDLLRNRILKFELLLTVSSFVVTCGALVTGVFGMNLLNHFEMNKVMFYVVLALIFGGMGAAFSKITRYGRKERLF
jgi:hypothetical protein